MVSSWPLRCRFAITLVAVGLSAAGLQAQQTMQAQRTTLPSVPLIAAPVVPKFAVSPGPDARCMVIGLPLRESWQVPEVNGRPALRIKGASRWQFTTLDTWPSGAVRWALGRALVAGGPAPETDLGCTFGGGASAGPDLAVQLPYGRIGVDTGVLQAEVRGAGFNVLDRVIADGVELVKAGASSGIVASLPDGEPLHVAPDAQLSIVENGPVYALLKVEGTLDDPAGNGVIDFTCRLGFTLGSHDVEVIFTVRNANIQRPQHTTLKSLELVLKLEPGGAPVARVAVPSGETQAALGPVSTLYAYQAYSDSFTEEVTGSGTSWLSPIPKTGPTTFSQEGYGVVQDGHVLFTGNKSQYPPNEWLDLSGSAGGCTVTIKQMPYFWPAALEATGAGQIDAGLFTPHNGAGYTWSWRQHESRTAVFSFHAGAAAAPVEVSRRAESPVAGRVADPTYYELTGVFPYDMLSVSEQNLAYSLLGIDHQVSISDLWFTATRFLPMGATGGENNHDYIERLLASEFLRTGGSGQYLTALDLALWKSESQILRSDNFDHKDDPGANNDWVPHTTNIAGDDEHRYVGGIVLAYHLTGDERYLDALKDELEILPTLTVWPHERSMYQSLVALVEVADALHAWPVLTPVIRQRVEFFCTPLLDPSTGVDGYGWDGPPGQGPRGCYVYSEQNKSEKGPGENYITRGFITSSMGPRALFRAAQELGPDDPDAALASSRLLDLAHYTRDELFPWVAVPQYRHLVYSYGVEQMHVNAWEQSDFHPILLGMAEAWRQTGDVGYLVKGLEQIQAFAAHGNMEFIDKRLEAQHFLRAVLDAAQQAGDL